MKTAKPAEIRGVKGRALPLPGDDVDTDRVIPARFMRCVTFDGLGQYAFHDERFDDCGNEKQHPLNDIRYQGAEILLVGSNFGCGSSREHAPQAIRRFGIRAIIGQSFADIFAGNCVAMGMPPVTIDQESCERLMQLVEKAPETEVSIDLENRTVSAGDFLCMLQIPESFRVAFTQGLWDTTSVLLSNDDAIRATAQRLPYVGDFV
jgi:3-isopropylmalate/(R)-2-methylmalate dehydratase small subunit